MTPIARELLAPSLGPFLITTVANGYLEGRVARPASRAPEAAR